MLANIKEKYAQVKAFVSAKVSALCLLLLAGFKKVVGERIYSICVGYVVLGQVFVQTQGRKVQAYYDSKVDKTTPYYQPIVKGYKFFAKSALFVLVYLPLVKHLVTVYKNQNSKLLDPELKKVALSTFALSVLLALCMIFFFSDLIVNNS